MSRKQQLQARAYRYTYKFGSKFAKPQDVWVDGYRAAMRDLRKELNRNTVGMSFATQAIVRSSRAARFLKPLR